MTQGYTNISCCECGMPIWMRPEYVAWLRADSRRIFFCPAGHQQHFSNQDNDLDAMRRERDRLRQKTAEYEDWVQQETAARKAAERSAAARKGQVTRLKNRAQAGVCPCCSRSFENLRRHMATKHPGFAAEEVK